MANNQRTRRQQKKQDISLARKNNLEAAVQVPAIIEDYFDARQWSKPKEILIGFSNLFQMNHMDLPFKTPLDRLSFGYYIEVLNIYWAKQWWAGSEEQWESIIKERARLMVLYAFGNGSDQTNRLIWQKLVELLLQFENDPIAKLVINDWFYRISLSTWGSITAKQYRDANVFAHISNMNQSAVTLIHGQVKGFLSSSGLNADLLMHNSALLNWKLFFQSYAAISKEVCFKTMLFFIVAGVVSLSYQQPEISIVLFFMALFTAVYNIQPFMYSTAGAFKNIFYKWVTHQGEWSASIPYLLHMHFSFKKDPNISSNCSYKKVKSPEPVFANMRIREQHNPDSVRKHTAYLRRVINENARLALKKNSSNAGCRFTDVNTKHALQKLIDNKANNSQQMLSIVDGYSAFEVGSNRVVYYSENVTQLIKLTNKGESSLSDKIFNSAVSMASPQLYTLMKGSYSLSAQVISKLDEEKIELFVLKRSGARSNSADERLVCARVHSKDFNQQSIYLVVGWMTHSNHAYSDKAISSIKGRVQDFSDALSQHSKYNSHI